MRPRVRSALAVGLTAGLSAFALVPSSSSAAEPLAPV